MLHIWSLWLNRSSLGLFIPICLAKLWASGVPHPQYISGRHQPLYDFFVFGLFRAYLDAVFVHLSIDFIWRNVEAGAAWIPVEVNREPSVEHIFHASDAAFFLVEFSNRRELRVKNSPGEVKIGWQSVCCSTCFWSFTLRFSIDGPHRMRYAQHQDSSRTRCNSSSPAVFLCNGVKLTWKMWLVLLTRLTLHSSSIPFGKRAETMLFVNLHQSSLCCFLEDEK